jgi:hypothetical protein
MSGRPQQEDHELKARLGYIMNSRPTKTLYLNQQKNGATSGSPSKVKPRELKRMGPVRAYDR